MASSANLAHADRVLRAVRAQASAIVSATDPQGKASLRRLLVSLRRADRQLELRLRTLGRAMGGQAAQYTSAQASAYRAQIQFVQGQVERTLLGLTRAQAAHAGRQSVRHTTQTLGELDQAFTGVVTPLRLREAAVALGLLEGVDRSLLRRHQVSTGSYGQQMLEVQERILSDALLQGLTQAETVERLMATGSYGDQAWRAWRVVRTETAHAYAQSRTAALREMREEIPDLRRIILATFDTRTAWDSVVVHGQIRAIDQPFEDGAGRVYLDPPARPNDRETTIPWRERWPRTDYSRELNEGEREEWRARIAARPRRAVTARPLRARDAGNGS